MIITIRLLLLRAAAQLPKFNARHAGALAPAAERRVYQREREREIGRLNKNTFYFLLWIFINSTAAHLDIAATATNFLDNFPWNWNLNFSGDKNCYFISFRLLYRKSERRNEIDEKRKVGVVSVKQFKVDNLLETAAVIEPTTSSSFPYGHLPPLLLHSLWASGGATLGAGTFTLIF